MCKRYWEYVSFHCLGSAINMIHSLDNTPFNWSFARDRWNAGKMTNKWIKTLYYPPRNNSQRESKETQDCCWNQHNLCLCLLLLKYSVCLHPSFFTEERSNPIDMTWWGDVKKNSYPMPRDSDGLMKDTQFINCYKIPFDMEPSIMPYIKLS